MGGVVCDPHRLSDRRAERICRAWIRRVARIIGPRRDIPAPDMMTSGQHMTWMLDEYETIHGEPLPGAITGKTLGAGGSLGRLQAGGLRPGLHSARSPQGARYRSGRPPPASRASAMLPNTPSSSTPRSAARSVCVSSWDAVDRRACELPQDDGIDLAELRGASRPARQHQAGHRPGAWIRDPGRRGLARAGGGHPDAGSPRKPDHAGQRGVDLEPGPDPRRRRQRPNGPGGRRRLIERGIYVLPDLLANAGGVTCSYFEQVQSNMNYYWGLSEVLSKLDRKLTSGIHRHLRSRPFEGAESCGTRLWSSPSTGSRANAGSGDGSE